MERNVAWLIWHTFRDIFDKFIVIKHQCSTVLMVRQSVIVKDATKRKNIFFLGFGQRAHESTMRKKSLKTKVEDEVSMDGQHNATKRI